LLKWYNFIIYKQNEGVKMSSPKEEVAGIFEKLSPENQQTLLMYARVAYIAENSVRKSIAQALGQEEKPSQDGKMQTSK
jgi:hypothetical protein